MKLRIQGNSIRFRLLRSEVNKFIEQGRLAETIHFSPAEQACFTYALEWNSSLTSMTVEYQPSEATVLLPKDEAVLWAQTEKVGIYSAVSIGQFGELTVSVEKDFACLDQSDAENEDTFPNPQIGAAC